MTEIPTIRIKSDIPGCEGGLDINEADFDPKVHVRFDAAPTPVAAPPGMPRGRGTDPHKSRQMK